MILPKIAGPYRETKTLSTSLKQLIYVVQRRGQDRVHTQMKNDLHPMEVQDHQPDQSLQDQHLQILRDHKNGQNTPQAQNWTHHHTPIPQMTTDPNGGQIHHDTQKHQSHQIDLV